MLLGRLGVRMIRQMKSHEGVLKAKMSSLLQKVPEELRDVLVNISPLVLFIQIFAAGCCHRESGSGRPFTGNSRS